MKTWSTSEEDFDASLQALVEEFTAGADIEYDRLLLEYDVYGSIAHVAALEELGVVDNSEAEKLRKELRRILQADLEITTEDEDVHTKVEAELTDRLGEVGKKIHTARSRNDQVLVDLRLFAKDRTFEAMELLFGLVESCHELAQRGSDVPMVGYTHYRKAMPSTVGLWAGSYLESLLDAEKMVDSAFQLIDQSPLGAGAGYGVPVKLNRKLTSDLLGFERVQNNPIYVMNSRGKFEFNLLAGFGSVQLDLSRLAEDLIVFSSDEFGFFALPEVFTTGSSIMPHKNNPDVLELLRGKTGIFPGRLTELYTLLHGLRSGYSRDLQESKKALFEGMNTVCASLRVLAPLIDGLEIEENSLLGAFDSDVLSVDEVLQKVQKGVPFREAYREVKRELANSEAEVSEEQIRELVGKRKPPHGTNDLKLQHCSELLSQKREKWRERKNRFHRSLRSLAGK